MTTERKTAVKKFFEGNSLVNKYDLVALEHTSEGLTAERILLTFQAFDELIPNLGVFTRIFQKLRSDLYEAVYSNELTGTAEGHDTGDSEYIQRLPYFSLVRQVYDERHKLAEELKEQLEIVNERLSDKHKQLEGAQETIADRESLINVLNTTKAELESVIENKDKQFDELKDELERTKEISRSNEHHLMCDIQELKEALEEAKNEITFLSQFKKGYDSLYNAFLDKSDTFGGESKNNRKSFTSTKRTNLLSGIESGHKLEVQILSVMNIAIEEYEKFIKTYKSDLLEKVVSSGNLNLQELDEADQELENVQIRYQNSVSNLLTELGLLQKHNTMLGEQLEKQDEIKTDIWKAKDVDSGKLSVTDDLKEVFETVSSPFIPNERVFSKYAAMLFTSNNGKTFEEFRDAEYCVSCGEKTLICPHKISGPEQIFVLPYSCSHIKLTRPNVIISRHFINERKLEIPHSTSEIAQFVSSSVHEQLQDSAVTSAKKTPKENQHREAERAYMVHSMQRLWEDYRQRTKIERGVPRSLDLEKTRSLLEQFLCYLVWTDEFMTDEKANMSILDTFYCFMCDHYLIEDVMFMAAHDFLSAILKFRDFDKMMHLVGHVFVGNVDASCLRYVLLVFDLISAVAWKEVEDFRPFCSVIYPFLSNDDLENLQMSYTSFSENRSSSHLVSSFIIHIILKHKEPRFLELENKLIKHEGGGRGQLTDNEFKDALDSILPLCSEFVRRRLYLQAERAVQWDGTVSTVPIMRLAQISGYLELHQIIAVMKDIVAQRVYKWRERPKSAVPAPQQQAAVMPENINQEKLLTMGSMKLSAANLNRQMKLREERKMCSL